MQEPDIAHEILAYLVDHSDAHDTLDGIVQWWLLEQQVRNQTAIVKEAVDELVGMGLILECQNNESQTYYRMNPRKYEEIQKFLRRELRGKSFTIKRPPSREKDSPEARKRNFLLA